MYKLFGIPNCDTVKKARTYLEKKKIDFEFIDFKKTPPTVNDIKRWQETFGDLPVNTKGVTYKKHAANFTDLKIPEKMKFLCENSSMIKRPILEKKGKVLAFGFDEETYKNSIS